MIYYLLSLLCATALGAYLLYIGYTFFSLTRISQRKTIRSTEGFFSIVVAAKDEEKNIPVLLESICGLHYPKDRFEIIVVDDGSIDSTIAETRKFQSRLPNLRILTARPHPVLKAKKAALECGINEAMFSTIVITDADCIVQPDWLSCIAGEMRSNDFIIGISPFEKEEHFVNKIARYENFKSYQIVFTMAGIGFPYSGIARNFAFSKEVFHRLGGYGATHETVSGDDDLLLREAAKNNCTVGVLLDPGSFVITRSAKELKAYLRQKARHTSTSHHYLFRHKLLLGVWYNANTVCLFSFLLAGVDAYFAIPTVAKIMIDMLTVSKFQHRFGYDFSFLEKVYLNLLIEVLLIVHWINSFRYDQKWK